MRGRKYAASFRQTQLSPATIPNIAIKAALEDLASNPSLEGSTIRHRVESVLKHFVSVPAWNRSKTDLIVSLSHALSHIPNHQLMYNANATSFTAAANDLFPGLGFLLTTGIIILCKVLSLNRTNLPHIKGHIQFDDVIFRYRPDGPEVLRRVTLDINPGEILGVVGPSGSGKSTLTKMIQRMYVPESGRVLVDGVDLALVDPAWLRRQVGVVLQENILFNRPMRENIALVDPTRDMQQVMAAAEVAGAHEFILQLPEGYDTQIDERGGNLSGGQRQRIAIARALFTNPRILILDEATSALDAESEEIIQKNLKRMAQGRTVVIIAHRLSALRQCNRIITIEAGTITEEGTHESLLAKGGKYSELWAKQMGTVNMGAQHA